MPLFDGILRQVDGSMTMLYWLGLVLGGGLALLSIFGDLLGFDHGGDASADVDADAHFDGGGGHDAAHAGAHGAAHILSLRSATYFLFAFGAVGVLLNWTWQGRYAPITFLFAAATGAASSAFSILLFRWVGRSESGELPHDSALIGLTGEMVLPLRGGRGKVAVALHGHEQELMARAFDDEAADPESWRNVVVVDVIDGVALVSPLESLPPAESPE